MLQRFKHHKYLNYLYLYAVSFLIYGASISGIGPYIPYLCVETGLVETDYSYIFSCRSFGMVMGAIITKLLQKKEVLNHQIIIIASLAVGLFSTLFSITTSTLWLGIWFFLTGVAYSALEVMLNVCIMLINRSQEIQFWMLLAHGLFGVGGLLGPIIIYLFETKAFFVLGVLTAAIAPFCLKMPSPQLVGCIPEHKQSANFKVKSASWTLEICLCLLLFMYIGNQCTYGGWISSYAVLTKVTDNKGATVFPSIFWIALSICRLSMIFFLGSSNKKLNILIVGCIWSGIISLAVIYLGEIKIACYLSAILFGITMSSIYPLIFAFPIDLGLNLQESQTANIVMAGVVSQGILTMFVGSLMDWISVNMLFYSLSFVSLVMWLVLKYSLHLISKQQIIIKNSDISKELIEIRKQNG